MSGIIPPKSAAQSRSSRMCVVQDESPREPEEHPKRPESQLAIRADGAVFMSLEDADDRDLTGREIVSFMRLTDEESKRAKAFLADGLSDAAANIVGVLPKRKEVKAKTG